MTYCVTSCRNFIALPAAQICNLFCESFIKKTLLCAAGISLISRRLDTRACRTVRLQSIVLAGRGLHFLPDCNLIVVRPQLRVANYLATELLLAQALRKKSVAFQGKRQITCQ
jgi:hypothetical protein